MKPSGVQLALGTVQFGIAYGVAGRGEPVAAAEVREILRHAWDAGIRVLDTAPGYGDIEARLPELMEDKPFEIVSKIPALPCDVESGAVAELVGGSIRQSRRRLGERLRTILFHRGEDLLSEHGDVAWNAATTAVHGAGLRLGASFYSPDAARGARERFPIAVAQLPGNALDQRLAACRNATALANVEIHLRSIFLQGLLLLPHECAVRRVPAAAVALRAWADWCEERDTDPLCAALGIAKALAAVSYCVVGVDSPAQLQQVVAAWNSAPLLEPTELASTDENVIDPRRWKLI